MYMQKDAELVVAIFDKYQTRQLNDLLDELVDALMPVHMHDARVRGVVYQNLGRLRLVTEAQHTRQQIQAKGSSVFPGMEPGLTWVTLTTISSVVFSMSQLQLQRASGLSEIGAGIWMAANPMQIFDRLGFAEKITAAGWTVHRITLQDYNGEILQASDLSAVAKLFGFETVALHRSALQRVLSEPLEPKLRTSVRVRTRFPYYLLTAP
jgi:hypothetical protein